MAVTLTVGVVQVRTDFSVLLMIPAVTDLSSVIVIDLVSVQPLAEVTVTV